MNRFCASALCAVTLLIAFSSPVTAFTKEERFCRERLRYEIAFRSNTGTLALLDQDIFYYDCMKTAASEMARIAAEEKADELRREKKKARLDKIINGDINDLFD